VGECSGGRLAANASDYRQSRAEALEERRKERGLKGGSMGGTGGEIRGKTKLETYKRFRAEVNRSEVEAATGLYMDAGNGTKQDLYAKMGKDEKTGEWVLYYHFGK
jgi:hypothetical protein